MKTNHFPKTIFMLIAMATFGIYEAQSQTSLGGAGTNTCNAGTTGTNCTFIGCQAGRNNGAARNTFVGREAGTWNKPGQDNVGIGYKALFTQIYGQTEASNYNIAIGNYALYTNNPTTDPATNAVKNCALGHSALYSNTTGNSNIAIGYYAGNANTTAGGNTFIGSSSGTINTTGEHNVFVGHATGYDNITGDECTYLGYASGSNSTADYNTFIGCIAGMYNTSGDFNTFTGWKAGFYNTTGSRNTFNGDWAGYDNTTGSYNTAIGYEAGDIITTGDSCTFVGYGADANASGLNNCAAFGYGAIVTASDKMYFGNAAVLGCYNVANNWSGTSDGRFKFNVKEEVKGLEFIKKLRPVTYQMNTQELDAFIRQDMAQATDSSGNIITTDPGHFAKSMGIIHSGFIAQEVEQAEQDCGFASSIVTKPSNNNDPYCLNYAEIVVPLVKAVQEQQIMIDSLREAIIVLSEGNRSQSMHDNGGNDNSVRNNQDIKLSLPDAATLGNARPNPNNGSTQISYYLPESISGAKIIFTDMLGKVVEEKPLQPGYGLLNIDTQDLPSGIYSYSLVINGKVIDNKKMIRNK